MSERVAIIDLGSNSARLIIMKVAQSGAYHLIYNQKEGVRLSEGMQECNLLQPAAMQRALDTLLSFSHMCKLHKATTIIAVATAAVRNARNGREFITEIARKTSINIRIISGEKEAHLGFVGAINTLKIRDAIVFDLGGASTEITKVQNGQPMGSVSLPIGAVNMTEMFELQHSSADKVQKAQQYINAELQKLHWLDDCSSGIDIIGIGGTARNIAKMDQRRKNYSYPKVHNYVISAHDYANLWEIISTTNLNERSHLPGLSSGRADIIVSGATIINCLFQKVAARRMIISACGIREGLFCEYFLSKYHESPALAQKDITRRSAINLLKYCSMDEEHAHRVDSFSCTLFDSLKPLHKMHSDYRNILSVAALLHDTGISINYHDHPRHGAYMVENANLFGFSHREQLLTAIVVGLHGGYNIKYRRMRLYNDFFRGDEWRRITQLGFFLALAESLDADQSGAIESIRVDVSPQALRIFCASSLANAYGLREATRLGYWCKREFGRDLQIIKTPVNLERGNDETN